ncbi:MAG: hypothetical protein AAB490_01605 [Patescibacteria group bacterium]
MPGRFEDKISFLDRYKQEIKPVLSKEEADLLDHVTDGPQDQAQIDAILEKQESKIFTWERPDADTDAVKVLLVGRDPGTAVGLKSLLRAMRESPQIRSIGILIDGVAQGYLSGELDDFQQINESRLVMPDIFKSAEDAYDVVINTMSASNNPATLTIMNEDLLSHDRPNAKSYLVYEAYEGSVELRRFAEQFKDMDGIFCNDEVAKEVVRYHIPDIDPDKIYPTGTGQTDSLRLADAEKLYRSGRERLSISEEAFVVSYLGTISSAYERLNLDPEVNEKSWDRAVRTMIRLAEENPDESFVLLYRYHPRDPLREETFERSQTLRLPENLTLRKATNEQGVTIDETIYASNAIASMTMTETLKAKHRKRQGIYLGFNEAGMGGEYLRKSYPPEIIRAMEIQGGMMNVGSDTELLTALRQLRTLPLEQPEADTRGSSAQRILDVLLRDQKK